MICEVSLLQCSYSQIRVPLAILEDRLFSLLVKILNDPDHKLLLHIYFNSVRYYSSHHNRLIVINIHLYLFSRQQLLCLDLSFNALTDLVTTVAKLSHLPLLRSLLLKGNPFAVSIEPLPTLLHFKIILHHGCLCYLHVAWGWLYWICRGQPSKADSFG